MSGPADLVIRGGRAFRGSLPGAPPRTGSEVGPPPPGTPTAIAIKNGLIVAVGSDADVRAWTGSRTRIVDARGGLIMSGFDDAHCHLIAGARAMAGVDLAGRSDPAALLADIHTAAAGSPTDAWVLGRGWTYAAFSEGGPDRSMLDEAVEGRPAVMTCFDGHTVWASSAALAAAGIGDDTPDPPNGRIRRDASGRATGVLEESAIDLLRAVIPVPDPATDTRTAIDALDAMSAAGITAIQDSWVDLDTLARWRHFGTAAAERVAARLALAIDSTAADGRWRELLDAYDAARAGSAGDPFQLGIIKLPLDGVVETRTAALLEPYADAPHRGRPEWSQDELDELVVEATGRGWQIEAHAIGDGAVRMAIDAFERAAIDGGPSPRHRIEHIETVSADDIARLAPHGIVASMQPYHATPTDNQVVVWAGRVGPERASRAWAWRSIARAGGVVAFGTDWPVVPFDPRLGLYTAVTRQTESGRPAGGWLPGERFTIAEALSAYTLGSAWAAHAERRRGNLEVGLDADIVILDRDLLAEPDPAAILETIVTMTIRGGHVVHGVS